jgi:hypothetical protein
MKLTSAELARSISALSYAIAATEKHTTTATEFRNLRTKYERALRQRTGPRG